MHNTPHIEHAELWLKEHAPTSTPSSRAFALAIEDASSVPVVGGAALTGSSLPQALEKDRVVGDLRPAAGEVADPETYQQLLKEFLDAPLTGCTSVLDMARIKAGYNPLAPAQAENSSKFDDYVDRVMRAPFFHLIDSSRTDYHRGEKDWNAAIDSILGLYDGIQADSKDQIRTSLENMAKAAASRSNTRQTNNLFAQSTIEYADYIEVYIYRSVVSMRVHKSKGSTSKQTDMTINKARMRFQTKLWPSYAPLVARRHIHLVSEWLDNNTTEPGNEPASLTCFEAQKA